MAMNLFDSMLILGLNVGRKRFFPVNMKEEAMAEFTHFIKHTKNNLKIVTGGISPMFYERKYVLDTIKDLLSNKKEIEIVFNKESNLDYAKRRLMSENKGLLELQKAYKNLLHISWMPVRPKGHYAVRDKNSLFIEEDHKSKKEREVYFYYKSKKAPQFFDLFNKLNCSEKVKEILV